MEISVANRQRKIGISSDAVILLVSVVLEKESAPFDEISVVFLSDRAMRRLNRRYTDRTETTDTIAFELSPDFKGQTPQRGIRLGEVIVSVERALAQSKTYRVRLEHELARLITHGLLHLCGYDDATTSGKKAMHRREDFYLSSLRKTVSSLVSARKRTRVSAGPKGLRV